MTNTGNDGTIVKNRSEIVFLYDVKNNNPNGDPLNEDRPRIDELTDTNIVTDVRLKRTIRDYLLDYEEMPLFIVEKKTEEGYIQDGKTRAKEFSEVDKVDDNKQFQEYKEKAYNKILDNFVDVRLFGATIPFELKWSSGGSNKQPPSATIKQTGPVQFKFGQSMHKVSTVFSRGTGAFASGEQSNQKTFREEYYLPYSLINFYGIINENVAAKTKLTDDDVLMMLRGIWNGTKNLITRSKVGQTPRMLMKVNYEEGKSHIGDLDSMIGKQSDVLDEEIRDISQVNLDVKELVSILENNSDKISNIELLTDNRVNFTMDREQVYLKKSIEERGIEVKPIELVR